MRRKITEEEIKFIKDNYCLMGIKYCADMLNLKKSSVGSIAFRNGLKVTLPAGRFKEKNIINIDDYIKVSDSNIAYILGLVWTDGCVTFANNNTKTPIIKHLCVKYDSESSNKIFSNLGWRKFDSENLKSIGKNTMTTHWISSKQLGNYLISENYRNKNNGTFIYKNFNDLKSHFLRGIFDGDGCITISNSRIKYKQIAIYFSSSSLQNWKFLTDILDEIGTKYKIRIIEDKLGKSSQLFINESLSIYNLCEFMYRDSYGVRLERKYKKYLEFLEYKKKFKRNNTLNEILN